MFNTYCPPAAPEIQCCCENMHMCLGALPGKKRASGESLSASTLSYGSEGGSIELFDENGC